MVKANEHEMDTDRRGAARGRRSETGTYNREHTDITSSTILRQGDRETDRGPDTQQPVAVRGVHGSGRFLERAPEDPPVLVPMTRNGLLPGAWSQGTPATSPGAGRLGGWHPGTGALRTEQGGGGA